MIVLACMNNNVSPYMNKFTPRYEYKKLTELIHQSINLIGMHKMYEK